MARKLIVLALVFVTIVGLAAAAAPAPSTTDFPPAAAPAPPTTDFPPAAAPAPPTTDFTAAEAPLSNDFIGTDDGGAASAPSADGTTVVPGPMGSTAVAEGPSEKDGATTLKLSAVAGVAAVAGYFFFF